MRSDPRGVAPMMVKAYDLWGRTVPFENRDDPFALLLFVTAFHVAFCEIWYDRPGARSDDSNCRARSWRVALRCWRDP